MLRLRPYHIKDAETILSWAKDEKAFYKWTAGVLGTYPLSLEQFHSVSDLMAFTAIDDNDVVGFFTMRRPTASFDELRFGFVIVDANKRGKGYGKQMLQLGLLYAKEIFGAKKVTHGQLHQKSVHLRFRKREGSCSLHRIFCRHYEKRRL